MSDSIIYYGSSYDNDYEVDYDELMSVLACMLYGAAFPSDSNTAYTAKEWALFFLKRFLFPELNKKTNRFLERLCLCAFSIFDLDEKVRGIVASYLPFDFRTSECPSNEVSRTPEFCENYFTFLIETRFGGEIFSKTFITFNLEFPINTNVVVKSGCYEFAENLQEYGVVGSIADTSLYGSGHFLRIIRTNY